MPYMLFPLSICLSCLLDTGGTGKRAFSIMISLSLTRLSCAQRTEKWTFSVVPSACSRRDRQTETGHFQGPVCLSRLPVPSDVTGRLVIFTVLSVPSCCSETAATIGFSCIFRIWLLTAPDRSWPYRTTLSHTGMQPTALDDVYILGWLIWLINYKTYLL